MPDQEPQNAAQDPTIGPLGGAALGALSGAAQSIKLDQPVAPPIKLDQPVYTPEIQAYAKQQNLPLDVAARHLRANQHPADLPDVGAHPNAAENFGLGMIKGLDRTLSGVAGAVEKIPEGGGLPMLPGPLLDIAKQSPFLKNLAAENQTGASDTEGFAQGAGSVLENIVEFVTGDEALKGASLAEKLGVAQKLAKFAEDSPKIAKALHIGMTALRQGGVSAAQTAAKGGTAEQAGENAAITGGVSAALGGIGAGASALYNSIASKTPEAIAAAKQAAADAGSDLATKIANKPVGSALEGAQEVKSLLGKAEDQMHADYAQGLDQIEKKIPDLLVDTKSSPLQQTAVDLLSNPEVPVELQAAMKGIIPEASRIQPLLEEFAEGKQYPWSGIQATRKVIGNTIRDLPFDSPLRHDLITIRGAIDNTMQQAVDKAGQPEISQELQNLRSVYAEQVQAFNSTAIKTLAEKNPNAVADVLLNKQSIFNVNTLRDLIGPRAMKLVEGQLLKRLIDISSTTGEFNSPSFVKRFNGLGPDVQQAIWGDKLPEIHKFLDVVQSIPKDSPMWNGLARYMEHRAIFDIALGGVAFGGLFGAGEAGGINPRRLLLPAGIIAAVIMLNSSAALNTASSILKGGAALTVPVVAGAEQPPAEKTEPNKEHSENMPEVPAGHTHVKTSDGSEFFVPNEHVENAKALDPGLQLLQQAGNPTNG